MKNKIRFKYNDNRMYDTIVIEDATETYTPATPLK